MRLDNAYFRDVEDTLREVEDILNRALAAGEIEETRYTYYGSYNNKRGNRIFCYTPHRRDGKFLSWEYVSTGQQNKIVVRHMVKHVRRKDARARALRLFHSYFRARG